MPNLDFIKDELEIEDFILQIYKKKKYKISKSILNKPFMQEIQDIQNTIDDD